MVGGDESDGSAPGQWGRDRNWLQRFGAGGEGSTARGQLDLRLAEAQEARCLPFLCRPNSLAGRGYRVGWAARGGQNRRERTWVKQEGMNGPLFSNWGEC